MILTDSLKYYIVEKSTPYHRRRHTVDYYGRNLIGARTNINCCKAGT
ncbi:hypothetical protein MNV_980019 [Candidatus Methanoperedens nitroreducens]|uniref:Uncharacterized protein n=1 Tax=Candidatus Methanoperedens nitratireducens TaxID=1392998 RepID=A0A284VUP7_9EURY|nr:hypothetical protein MNV_980019 [Candidatus Methanoperedens nitroreducens]